MVVQGRHKAEGVRVDEAAADDLPSGQLGSASPRHEIGPGLGCRV